MDPAGRRLKIPVWMLLPECAEIEISQQPHLGKHALLSLASLIASQLASKDPVHDNLLQTPGALLECYPYRVTVRGLTPSPSGETSFETCPCEPAL